jgi:hypothetical protein
MPRQVSIEDLKKDMANLLDEVVETRIPTEKDVHFHSVMPAAFKPASRFLFWIPA